jgi:hypothetical protein
VIDGIEERQKWRHVFRIDAIHANCNNFEPVENLKLVINICQTLLQS